MKPLMYKQRPAYPALIGAFVFLCGGMLCYAVLKNKVKYGEVAAHTPVALAFIFIAIALIFFVAAFARYQFTHLWIKPRPHGNRRKPQRM